jgi:hypothetical protein
VNKLLEFNKQKPSISAEVMLKDINDGKWSIVSSVYLKAITYYLEKSLHFDKVYDALLKKEKELKNYKARYLKSLSIKPEGTIEHSVECIPMDDKITVKAEQINMFNKVGGNENDK